MELGIEGITEPVRIGAGGFATVYRARQPAFDRFVAVKILDLDPSDEAARAAFDRECVAIGRLSGRPNVLTVHDSGLTPEGRPYLIMAYMARGSFEARLERDERLPWQEALAVGVKVAWALEGAHSAGILHRDVKPANILISDDGEPQLADFGIAKIASATGTTRGGRALTPGYAAPEMFGTGPLSPASDVYSLGATIHALVSGEPAFDADDLLSLLGQIANQPVPDLRPLGVPDAACKAIEHAMAKDARDRPSTAEGLAMELDAALAAEQVAPGDVAALQRGPSVDRRPGARRRLVVAGAGVLVAVATIVLVVIARSQGGEPAGPGAGRPPGAVLAQGQLALDRTEYADLEAGRIGLSERADVIFGPEVTPHLFGSLPAFLAPLDGEPDKATCSAALASRQEPFVILSPTDPGPVCVSTSEGNIAVVTNIAVAGDEGPLRFDYTVWR
ncbi:MAG: serine/threonine-protein kinase [Acidimicrobiales bacterium]